MQLENKDRHVRRVMCTSIGTVTWGSIKFQGCEILNFLL